jgi:hypothetical protein
VKLKTLALDVALKASDPTALKGINSIFVTVEPQRGVKTPAVNALFL